ncbi:MAG: SLBB domain-containing protein [Ignavibacteria bacterium]
MRKFFIIFLILCSLPAFAQDEKERLGIQDEIKLGSNYYNYGDKDKVNIEVLVWGTIPTPGKYLIPQGTRLLDLITLCGGPSKDTKLEDIRIVRTKNDSLGIKEDKVIKLNYNDYLWDDKISLSAKQNPVLMAGDMIVFPLDQKFSYRENLYLILSITSTLVSLTTFLITVLRK